MKTTTEMPIFPSVGCVVALLLSWPTGHWCLSKDVVKLLMSHCQESNILGFPKPNLLHFSEATNEITPSASVSWRSKNLGCQNTAKKNLHPARAAKAHSSGWYFPMPATSQCM
jgi:hypothetical protein